VSAIAAEPAAAENVAVETTAVETTAVETTAAPEAPSDAPSSTERKGEGQEPLEDSDCPPEGEDCTATRCCADPGFQCYKKNDKWASCLTNCTKGMLLPGDPEPTPWDCEEFGAATPESVHEGWTKGARRGEDCTSSTFCAGMDDNCYMKNPEYGSCMMECDPEAPGTKGWSCTKLY
jgi:hypothetical protein